MRGNAIWLVWAVGGALALALILIGPAGLGAAINDALVRLRLDLTALAPRTVAVLRALAIALMVVFLGLSGLASRRGLPVGRALFAVVTVFVLLVGLPGDPDEEGLRWAGAFLLCLVAALMLTLRLRSRVSRP